MKIKAQISMEFLLVFTFSLLLLLPAFYLMSNYIQDTSSSAVAYQVSQIGKIMVETAQTVHAHGKDARLVVEVEMPDYISGIKIINNNLVQIDYLFAGQENMYLSLSSVNITGEFVPADWSPGKKSFQIDSKGDYVLIKRIV
ncbi:MAG: hypothetical protein QXK37_04825 [Candidatus Woesearchaeota archaeon]